MANSAKPGPHGSHHHHRHAAHRAGVPGAPIAPAKTPGVLGRADQGDPSLTTLLGWTPNVTGLRDWADHTWQAVEGWGGEALHSAESWGQQAWSRVAGVGSAGRAPTGQPIAVGPTPVPPAGGGITLAQLKKMFPGAGNDYLQKVADDLNADLKKYGLDTLLRRAHFFAQVREEGGPALKGKIEDLTYSPTALKGLFGYYKKHPAEADQDGYERDPKNPKKFIREADQEQIGNKAYGGRNGNGSVDSGDGWKYRGRGLIQTTGRGNYAAVTKTYHTLYGEASVDFEAKPELMEQFPYTLRTAVCFWVAHGLPALADKGDKASDVDAITAVVNVNTKSYENRQKNFTEAYDAFK